MALSSDQKATVQAVIDYLSNGYEKPLDGNAVDKLTPLATAFGFTGQIPFVEGLRVAPHSTLLKALLAVAA